MEWYICDALLYWIIFSFTIIIIIKNSLPT